MPTNLKTWIRQVFCRHRTRIVTPANEPWCKWWNPDTGEEEERMFHHCKRCGKFVETSFRPITKPNF